MDVPGFKLGRQYDGGQYYQNYSALDLKNQKTVNIQLFNPSLVANQTFYQQFQKITHKLVNTPFGIISPILHAEISNRACYVITERFTCSQDIFSSSLNAKKYQVLQLALKIAESLDELHKARLVHGGIELNTFCLKSSGQLVLKPPMLQRVIPALRPFTFKALTTAQRQYFAPEAYEDLTPATDYYALGVLIYQLLFGVNSFNAAMISFPDRLILREGHQDLETLFRQLLADEVEQRIQSYAQFKTALQQCGLKMATTNPNNNLAATKNQPKIEKHTGSSLKWIIPTTGVAISALVGTLYFSPLREVLPPLSGFVAQQTTEVSEASISAPNQSQQISSQNESENFAKLNGFNRLYQQAKTQIESSPKTALRIIDVALKLSPNNTDAINLKHRIQKQIEIESLFEDAEHLLQEMQLITPKGDNAYESYKMLANLLSPTDERVQKGFSRIADSYFALSENEVDNNQLDKALEYIDLGLSIKADHPRLLALRNTVIERKKLLEIELQVAQQEHKQRLRDKEVTGTLIRRQVRQIKNSSQPASNSKAKNTPSNSLPR
ncbi:MAG: hypothetical protein P8163_10345 [Candidatus Thiodiazotropha sp.]